ncbi:MAG TPA: hypothetical protein VF172_12320 [Nitrososphaera sp.]
MGRSQKELRQFLVSAVTDKDGHHQDRRTGSPKGAGRVGGKTPLLRVSSGAAVSFTTLFISSASSTMSA